MGNKTKAAICRIPSEQHLLTDSPVKLSIPYKTMAGLQKLRPLHALLLAAIVCAPEGNACVYVELLDVRVRIRVFMSARAQHSRFILRTFSICLKMRLQLQVDVHICILVRL